jgi:hypothetical protein
MTGRVPVGLAAERQHELFREQLSHQPETSRTEGNAHRHLVSPRCGTSEQQARDVRARDEQNQNDNDANNARGGEQRGSEIRIDGCRAKRDQMHRAIAVCFWILARKADRTRRRSRLRLRNRGARGQAADDRELQQPALGEQIGRIGSEGGMR